jgi:hypothetical protein
VGRWKRRWTAELLADTFVIALCDRAVSREGLVGGGMRGSPRFWSLFLPVFRMVVPGLATNSAGRSHVPTAFCVRVTSVLRPVMYFFLR